MLQKEAQKLIHSAIDRPTPQQRTAFLLHKEEGLTYAAIGIRMGVATNTVRKLFGATPYQFFLDGRLEEAERRLVTTTKSITEIAYTLQYNHLSSFSSEFTLRFGCTPSEYRRRHKTS